MEQRPSRLIATCVALLVACTLANAQKGTGDATGIARAAERPTINTVTGQVLAIESGPCEKTTGRSLAGTHLIVQDDNTELNIHLGPEPAVEHVIAQIARGTTVTLEVFRSEAMPQDAFIAKSLTLDGKIVHLRDANLRPSWAYARRNAPGRGYGFGAGGRLHGPCW